MKESVDFAHIRQLKMSNIFMYLKSEVWVFVYSIWGNLNHDKLQ